MAGAVRFRLNPPVVMPALLTKVHVTPGGACTRFGQAPSAGVAKEGSAITGWASATSAESKIRARSVKNIIFVIGVYLAIREGCVAASQRSLRNFSGILLKKNEAPSGKA